MIDYVWFLLAVALCAFLAFQLIRLCTVQMRARRTIAAVKSSGEHPAKIDLFVKAQTKLMKADQLMGVLLLVGVILTGFAATKSALDLF